MTDHQRQRLSELKDGELDPIDGARLLDALARDAQLRDVWERYHLVGLAIRGEPIMPASRGIAAAVRARIQTDRGGRVRPGPFGRRRRLGRQALGIGLAAAAAFLVVFVVPSLIGHRVGRVPMGPPAAPFATASASESKARRWDLDQPELVSKLDLFLVTHQETAPVSGAKGLLPYATFVGYDAGR